MTTPSSRAPIVLVHGLLGFDRISVGRLELKRYFPGIDAQLEAAGHRVCTARLSRTRGVAARAQELRQFILRRYPNEPVHIFGHSMGGLDARFMISKLDMGDRVLSLTTIGTPHRGCSFAEWGIRSLGWFLKPILRLLRISSDAFYDLTPEFCRRFNEAVPDVPGVRYLSVAGECDESLLGPIFRLPSRIVRNIEGPNDGIVSVASAAYGEHCEIWHADHLNLVNWPNRFARARGLWGDRAADFVKLAHRAHFPNASNAE
jgi:triacylglycerol lipase